MELTEDFVELECPSDPRVSPDGSWVVWVTSPYGQEAGGCRSAIWIASPGGGRARRLTWGAGEDRQPRWAPDGKGIAFVSDRKHRGVFGLYLLGLDGGEAEPLHVAERSVGSFEWSPDASRIAFIAPNDPNAEDRREDERDDPNVWGENWQLGRLRILDLVSRDVTLVEFDQHVTSLAWSPDGERIAFVAAPNPEHDSWLNSAIYLTVVSDNPEKPARLAAAPGAYNLTWARGEARVLYAGPAEALAQSGFVIWSAALDGHETRVVAPVSGEEACAWELRAPDGGPVVVYVVAGLSDRIERLADRATVYEEPGTFTSGWDMTWRGGKPMIGLVRSRGSEPPEVWAGEPGGSLRKLSDHHKQLSEITFGRQEPFFWEAADGTKLDGLFVTPPTHQPARRRPSYWSTEGRMGCGLPVSIWDRSDGSSGLQPLGSPCWPPTLEEGPGEGTSSRLRSAGRWAAWISMTS